jgi:hypothetical protein
VPFERLPLEGVPSAPPLVRTLPTFSVPLPDSVIVPVTVSVSGVVPPVRLKPVVNEVGVRPLTVPSVSDPDDMVMLPSQFTAVPVDE